MSRRGQRQLSRAYLVDPAGLKQSAERGVLVETAYSPRALCTTQHGVGSRSRQRADTSSGSHLAAASAGVVGHIGGGVDDETRLGHVGDALHQPDVAAFALQGQLSLEVLERSPDVAAYVARSNGQVAPPGERTIDLASRGAYDTVISALLNGEPMVQDGHGGRAVHVNLVYLAASQQHGRAIAAEGAVPCPLRHDTLPDDDPRKVVHPAVVEVQLAGTILHEVARTADLSLQREGTRLLGHGDGGRVADGDGTVGAHVVAAEHEAAAVELQVARHAHGRTDGTALASVVEVGHGQPAAVDDGAPGVVAILHVERHVSVWPDDDVARATDAAIALQGVASALEVDATGGHRFVERDGRLLCCTREHDGVARHKGRGGGGRGVGDGVAAYAEVQ